MCSENGYYNIMILLFIIILTGIAISVIGIILLPSINGILLLSLGSTLSVVSLIFEIRIFFK